MGFDYATEFSHQLETITVGVPTGWIEAECTGNNCAPNLEALELAIQALKELKATVKHGDFIKGGGLEYMNANHWGVFNGNRKETNMMAWENYLQRRAPELNLKYIDLVEKMHEGLDFCFG